MELKKSTSYVKPSFVTEANSEAEADKFIEQIGNYPKGFKGKGIVICGGGIKYFTNAWVLINHLKRLGCKLPVEFWYLGEKEMDETMLGLFKELGVVCIDGYKVREKHPVRILNGWELKAFALLHSSFEEVLLLDADNVPVKNPEELFMWAQYTESGAVFWPDVNKLSKGRRIWELLGISYRDEAEFESGQILVNKKKCWKVLQLSMWLNEYSDLYYRYIHGDKETFHMAFRKLEQPYEMTKHHVILNTGVMYQHDFIGKIFFQHRNSYKWNYYGNNPHLEGFEYEEECLAYLDLLKNVWDGKIGKKEKRTDLFKSETERKLLTNAWVYERIGYDKRPMAFLRNGMIGTGRGGCETSWELKEEKTKTWLNIRGKDDLICSLEFDKKATQWIGKWLKHEQMPILLSLLN